MSQSQQQLKKLSLDELQDRELNTCDKCGGVESTYRLNWITSDDFTLRPGEILPKSTYKYDALCESCYMDEVVFQEETDLVKKLHNGESVKATDLARSMGIEVVNIG